jgi:hypothetical protein
MSLRQYLARGFLSEEYRVWADSVSVSEYITFICQIHDFPMTSSNQLGEYWEPIMKEGGPLCHL